MRFALSREELLQLDCRTILIVCSFHNGHYKFTKQMSSKQVKRGVRIKRLKNEVKLGVQKQTRGKHEQHVIFSFTTLTSFTELNVYLP